MRVFLLWSGGLDSTALGGAGGVFRVRLCISR